MEDYHNTKKILGASFRGKRAVGRHCSGWEDNMQKDTVSLLHIQNWKLVAQSRENWRKKIGEAMT
jgi:ABC-type phosphate/phosphonate transport system ATPase subunit